MKYLISFEICDGVKGYCLMDNNSLFFPPRVLFLEENISGKEREIRETQDQLATFKFEYYQQIHEHSNDYFGTKNNFMNKVIHYFNFLTEKLFLKHIFKIPCSLWL